MNRQRVGRAWGSRGLRTRAADVSLCEVVLPPEVRLRGAQGKDEARTVVRRIRLYARRNDLGAGLPNPPLLGASRLFPSANPAPRPGPPTRRSAHPAARALPATPPQTKPVAQKKPTDRLRRNLPCGGSRSTDRASLPRPRPGSASHAVRDLNSYLGGYKRTRPPSTSSV
jgi:hypothetical protein